MGFWASFFYKTFSYEKNPNIPDNNSNDNDDDNDDNDSNNDSSNDDNGIKFQVHVNVLNHFFYNF